MKSLEARTSDSLPRWRELVGSLALEVDTLAESFLARLNEAGVYQSGLVPEEHLRASARDSLALILRALATDSTTTKLSDLPNELGRLRARQGVRGEDLVAAVRLDFSVVWSAMLAQVRPDDMAVLALHAESLWRVVDDYARAVQQSYLEERALMAAATRDEQITYLAELLAPGGQASRNVPNIARALGVDADDTFRVVVAETAASHDAHRAAAQVSALGERLFVLNQPGRVVLVWPAGTSGPEHDLQQRQLRGMQGGLVPDVEGLGAVPAAAATAYEICRTLRPEDTGLFTLAQTWTRVTKSQLDEQHGFSTELLSRLQAVAEPDRSVIVDTVRAYLATGSLTGSAERLYCHRNTVLNRLGRFQKLTGLDVTIPEQAAIALVALA
ncbi:helix-turn-helix domain-containing protein [Streptomyces sp. LHD-70]|uniref:PucR family transcriptional regulator n=1 Tax=Streptomyces sp. LHD-70 TaxID=3072140 RepID=UPI00280D14C5|nr:helix-turn-helix domain-containing protein [Streptomyces sp. LHD-70]MDQ8702526.1 helix-turn-helix domain-containing protein [Streptomyces sp. LHD-70]